MPKNWIALDRLKLNIILKVIENSVWNGFLFLIWATNDDYAHKQSIAMKLVHFLLFCVVFIIDTTQYLF